MKSTLTFSLPDDREEYEMHINGPDYHSVLWETLETFCRRKIKYNEGEHSAEYIKAVEDVRAFIHNELESRNLLGKF